MKRATEAEFGKALREVDGLRVYVYRPPDPRSGEGVSNWKPADFLAWYSDGGPIPFSRWFEVKDVDDLRGYPFADLRPSQVQGIRDAAKMGIPYWLAIWWRRHKEWTISNAARVLAYRDDRLVRPERVQESIDFLRLHGTGAKLPAEWLEAAHPTSIPRELLMSRFGISSTKAQLSSTLKAILLGEVS